MVVTDWLNTVRTRARFRRRRVFRRDYRRRQVPQTPAYVEPLEKRQMLGDALGVSMLFQKPMIVAPGEPAVAPAAAAPLPAEPLAPPTSRRSLGADLEARRVSKQGGDSGGVPSPRSTADDVASTTQNLPQDSLVAGTFLASLTGGDGLNSSSLTSTADATFRLGDADPLAAAGAAADSGPSKMLPEGEAEGDAPGVNPVSPQAERSRADAATAQNNPQQNWNPLIASAAADLARASRPVAPVAQFSTSINASPGNGSDPARQNSAANQALGRRNEDRALPAAAQSNAGDSESADPKQPRTVRIPVGPNGRSVALTATGGKLGAIENLTAPRRGPQDAALPYGLFTFTVSNVAVGGSAIVEMTLPDGAKAGSYYKQDRTTGELFEFEYDGKTGAVIEGSKITLHLVDGGRGDYDGVANGVIVDPGGPGLEVIRVGYSGADGLEGWTIVESGGANGGNGSVVAESNALVMREGNSYLTSLERNILVPETPSLVRFSYEAVFDTGSDNVIEDAFEAALVDADGNPLLGTIRLGRDSYFNLTEDEPVATGKLTTHAATGTLAGTVDVDISGLKVGSTAKLILRLVNNDGDTGTLVRFLAEQQPPVAHDDAYTVAEDGTLTVAAAGVLTNDTDPDNDPLKAIPVQGASHGTATLNEDGSFSYTPNANFIGTDTFTYKANDGTADSNVATVTITVTEVNDAPTALDDTKTTAEDTPLTFNSADLVANDSPGPANEGSQALTVTSVGAATNGTVSLNPDGTITYTPNGDFFGTDSFTYTIEDNGTTDGVLDKKTATATVTVTVTEVNDAPTAVDDTQTTAEDVPLTFNSSELLANDSPGPANETSQSLTVTAVGAASHGTVALNADGTISYTPHADYFGPDSFIYTIQDNGTTDGAAAPLTATGTVHVTVAEVNDPPTAADDGKATKEDTPLTFAWSDLLVNDTKGPANESDQTLTVISVGTATNGTVVLNGDGTITYTPNANYTGTDTFTYTIEDNGTTDGVLDKKTATATVAVTVSSVNDPPTAVDDAYTVAEDSAATSFDVLANDSTAPDTGETLTIVSVSAGSAGGTITVVGGATISYQPAADFYGTETFQYTINDGTPNSNDTATVTVTVTEVNDPPTAADDAKETDEDTPLTFNTSELLTNDSPGPANESGQALTVISVGTATNGTVVLNGDGTITYTPNANFHGTDTFTYTVQDNGTTNGLSDPLTATATVTVTVHPVNDPPVVQVSAVSANEGSTVNLSATFSDPENTDTHTAVIDWGDGTTSPGTISGTTVTGSHTYPDNGSYTVTVSVTDSGTPALTGTGTATATIANVAPDLAAGYGFTAVTQNGTQVLGVMINAHFTDPGYTFATAGTQETFTAVIDWGDGTQDTITPDVVQGSAGTLTRGSFSGTHVYATGGTYTATVTVTDDDQGSDSVVLTTFAVLNMNIDVVPHLNLKSQGRIPVKIQNEDNPGIDLSLIDPDTVRFGPAGARVDDPGWVVNGSGDVRAKFRTQESGIRPTDTVAYLTGRMTDGSIFVGLDEIIIAPGSQQGPNGVTPPEPSPAGSSKFYVVDAEDDLAYRYDTDGAPTGSITLDTAARDARGVTIWDAAPDDLTDAVIWSVGLTEQVASESGWWTMRRTRCSCTTSRAPTWGTGRSTRPTRTPRGSRAR